LTKNALALSRCPLLCLSRRPSRHETSQLLGLLEKETLHFSSGNANPWDLAAANPAEPPQVPKDATPPQLAAWTAVCRVLLNLDETIIKE